jgi:hypothetical protein
MSFFNASSKIEDATEKPVSALAATRQVENRIDGGPLYGRIDPLRPIAL